MLYRGSVHGYKSENFHDKCDGLSPTLSITKTSTGKIFGFYTPIPWSNTGGSVAGDGKSFVFSIQNGQIFKFKCIAK